MGGQEGGEGGKERAPGPTGRPDPDSTARSGMTSRGRRATEPQLAQLDRVSEQLQQVAAHNTFSTLAMLFVGDFIQCCRQCWFCVVVGSWFWGCGGCAARRECLRRNFTQHVAEGGT